jgi:hypothetical protein
MTDRKLYAHEIHCARQIDGHAYQRLHREFNFTNALETFGQSGNWDHLSAPEAMATLSLLEKALQLWTHSKSMAPEYLDRHFDAFHSLYKLIKAAENSDES